MPDPDKKFLDTEDEAKEKTSYGYNTEDDAPRDDEPPPKDQGEDN